ncbi:hypothetical protein G6L45_16240 [Agrobacterium rhizogenes]|nr:hypothetical protein [Rhizobium rhizogenes]NTH97034.1 hypothetical protein [Rhizobium rhizogenes]NTJ15220.1 hypothetical protein [Rhizobium rhizogenes]
MVFPSKQSVTAYGADAQKAAALIKKEKKAIRATPRQRAAIDLMVFEGLKRADAAKRAGITDNALRIGLSKPHVLAYLNQQQEMLRTSMRPRALNRIGELMDKADSDRVRLDAAKYIDGMDRGAHQVGATQVNVQVNSSVTVTPGYVIRIDRSNDRRESSRKIEHLDVDDAIPLSALEGVPDDD